MVTRGFKFRLGLCVAVMTCVMSGRARAQMEPNRAGRIRVACAAARASDTPHYVVAASLVAVGAALFAPNVVDASRGDVGFFQQGVGLGLAVGGLVLALRPYGPGGWRLLETCERFERPHDYDNPRLLRDAERYLNALAISRRAWDLEITAAAAVVSVGGALVAYLVFNPDNAMDAAGAQSARQQRAYYVGAFVAVPIGFLLDLVVLPPPIRAAIVFHSGGFRAPRTLSLRPTLGPEGFGIAGTF